MKLPDAQESVTGTKSGLSMAGMLSRGMIERISFRSTSIRVKSVRQPSAIQRSTWANAGLTEITIRAVGTRMDNSLRMSATMNDVGRASTSHPSDRADDPVIG